MNSELPATPVSSPASSPSESDSGATRRVTPPRPHRMVALGLMLTAGSKLMFASMFAMLMVLMPDIDPMLGVMTGVFAVYGLAELALAHSAWRDQVRARHAAAIVIGFALFGAAGFFAGLDPYTEGGFANLFSACAAAYVLAGIGWVWGARRARSTAAA